MSEKEEPVESAKEEAIKSATDPLVPDDGGQQKNGAGDYTDNVDVSVTY